MPQSLSAVYILSYQDEVRKFLKNYSMEWDERYIWD
jgi:hypothetical protein